jgi:hypothetical protein
MPHVKTLVSGACRIESDAIYFRQRASEERTAALHARHADIRQRHLQKAEAYEDRVRAITLREQHRSVQRRSPQKGAVEKALVQND